MNFIIIFADQMHKYALGKLDSEILTPNLDQLCEDGVLFKNGYSNNPICGPYRGTLFTGLYTSHNKVYYNGNAISPNNKSLAACLNEQGYETSFVGKWHLGGNGNQSIPREQQGDFNHFIGYQCYNGFYQDVLFWDNDEQPFAFDEHRTEVTTNIAIERLHQLHATGKPFLHVVGYQAPHYPEQPSPEYAALYKDKVIHKTPDYQEVDPYTPTWSPLSPRPVENCPDFQRYGNNMDEYIRLYNAMVTQVDAGIGRILEEVRTLGLEEDTVIVFTADHGDMQGSHGMKNKCLPHEKSCGVPFIVKDPKGSRKDLLSDALISGIDIYPSLLDYANVPSAPQVDGNSFKGYMRGEEESFNPVIVAEFIADGAGWQMIRDDRYKLSVKSKDQTPYLLFDMINDPYEMTNLVDDPTYDTIKQDLLIELAKQLA